MLFDLPEVVAGVQKTLERVAAAAANCVGGSFLEGVPAGCDAYVTKHIIHDWDDQAVSTLLRCAVRAQSGGKGAGCRAAGHARGAAPLPRCIDIEMLVVTDGGRERTAAEFGELFA